MRLVPHWRKVLRRAWSIRLLFIAGVLSGLEAATPFFGDVFDLSPRIFALLTFLIVAAAFVARLVAQEAFHAE